MIDVRRSLHAFLLVLAFLFAQGGMAAHAVSHLAPVTQDGDEGLAHDPACELCVGYAQLSGSAPLPVQLVLQGCLARHEAPQNHVFAFVTHTAFHSRARAPPFFS
jgi:hypothetical protein